MIQVTSIDKQGSSVTLSASSPQQAEQVVQQLQGNEGFIRVVDGRWALVYPARVRVAHGRLAHIIATHANVVLQ